MISVKDKRCVSKRTLLIYTNEVLQGPDLPAADIKRNGMERFETSDLNYLTYPCAHCLYGWGPFRLPQRLIQPPNSLRGQIWPQIWNQWPPLPIYPCAYAYCLYDLGLFLTASHATTASKQPQRSNMTSDWRSVIWITDISKCILLICFWSILWPLRSLQPPNSLRGQIWPQIWNLWPKHHLLPSLFLLFRPLFARWEKED